MNEQPRQNAASALSRLPFTVFLFGFSALFLVVALVYAEWREYRRFESRRPVSRHDTLAKALRGYAQRYGHFPEDFAELIEHAPSLGLNSERLTNEARAFSGDGCFYRYARIDAKTATLWSVPVGPRANEGATYFRVLRESGDELWKGPPLSIEEITRTVANPAEEQLAWLGLGRTRAIRTDKSGSPQTANSKPQTNQTKR